MRTLLAVSVLSILSGGCGDACTKTFNKMIECAPDAAKKEMESGKAEFLQQCSEEMAKAHAEDKKLGEEAAACASKGDCTAYESCLEDVSKKKMRADTLAGVTKAMASKEYEDALIDCDIAGEQFKDDAEIGKACAEMRGAALAGLMADATKLRDEGADSISKCVDLKSTAEKVSDEAKASAEALCVEASAAERAKEARADAKANVEKKEPDIPVTCTIAMDDLAKLDSDWAAGARKATATACYLDLGKIVMAAKIPEMKYVCDFQVQTVYDAVKANELAETELDAWMEKAAKLCEKG